MPDKPNLKANYILISKESYGGVIKAYIVLRRDGKTERITKGRFLQMASANKIGNVTYSGGQLKGLGIGISEIPQFDKKTGHKSGSHNINIAIENYNSQKQNLQLFIVNRLMHGTECIGYTLADSAGNQKRIPREKVFSLVKKNYIPNISYQIYKGKEIIKGIGFNISSLPAIRVDKKGNETENSNEPDNEIAQKNIEEQQTKKKNKQEKIQPDIDIIGRVMYGRTCIGYKLRNSESKEIIVKREDTIKLVQKGRVKGVKAVNCNGSVLLQGTTVNLKTLPIIKQLLDNKDELIEKLDKLYEELKVIFVEMRKAIVDEDAEYSYKFGMGGKCVDKLDKEYLSIKNRIINGEITESNIDKILVELKNTSTDNFDSTLNEVATQIKFHSLMEEVQRKYDLEIEEIKLKIEQLKKLAQQLSYSKEKTNILNRLTHLYDWKFRVTNIKVSNDKEYNEALRLTDNKLGEMNKGIEDIKNEIENLLDKTSSLSSSELSNLLKIAKKIEAISNIIFSINDGYRIIEDINSDGRTEFDFTGDTSVTFRNQYDRAKRHIDIYTLKSESGMHLSINREADGLICCKDSTLYAPLLTMMYMMEYGDSYSVEFLNRRHLAGIPFSDISLDDTKILRNNLEDIAYKLEQFANSNNIEEVQYLLKSLAVLLQKEGVTLNDKFITNYEYAYNILKSILPENLERFN